VVGPPAVGDRAGLDFLVTFCHSRQKEKNNTVEKATQNQKYHHVAYIPPKKRIAEKLSLPIGFNTNNLNYAHI
jgi:hypothetical protein